MQEQKYAGGELKVCRSRGMQDYDLFLQKDAGGELKVCRMKSMQEGS